MPFTTYFDTKVLSLAIGQVAYPIPATLYVGLSSTPPSQIQTGTPPWGFTEPVGNAYARVAVLNNATNWGLTSPQPASGCSVQNRQIITYQQSANPWLAGATLGWFGLWDALANGNLLLFGTCSPAQAVDAANITLSFLAGALTATIN